MVSRVRFVFQDLKEALDKKEELENFVKSKYSDLESLVIMEVTPKTQFIINIYFLWAAQEQILKN